jgi:hypothetical protein
MMACDEAALIPANVIAPVTTAINLRLIVILLDRVAPLRRKRLRKHDVPATYVTFVWEEVPL